MLCHPFLLQLYGSPKLGLFETHPRCSLGQGKKVTGNNKPMRKKMGLSRIDSSNEQLTQRPSAENNPGQLRSWNMFILSWIQVPLRCLVLAIERNKSKCRLTFPPSLPLSLMVSQLVTWEKGAERGRALQPFHTSLLPGS